MEKTKLNGHSTDQKIALEKSLPWSEDAEKGVLGSIIIDPHAYDEVSFLQSQHFYRNLHRVMYSAMQQIASRGEPVDFITLIDEIERSGHFTNQGEETGYITSLINYVPTARNAKVYADIVLSLGQCRLILEGVQSVAERAYVGDRQEAQEQLEVLAYQASLQAARTNLAHVNTLSASFLDELDMLQQNRGTITGVPTGWTDLDRLTNGLNKSDLIILAARPRVGKTSMALNIASNASIKYGKTVAIFSLEMSKEQLFKRLVAMEAGIDLQRLRTGWVEDEEWEHMSHALDLIETANIYIDDTPNITTSEMRSKIRAFIASGMPIDLIIVDYLQYMRPSSGKRSDNRVQEVGEISHDLKVLARELDVPVLALAQLSRAVEMRQNKKPQLSDLRESGSIENDADIIMFIDREDVYNPETERQNIADLYIAKHRNGPEGVVTLFFKKSQTKFFDLEVTPPQKEGY
jgi:replicative DNA helicase